MIILSIDTSGPSLGAAVLQDEKILYESVLDTGRTHSVSLLPMVDDGLKRTGLTLADIDLFACVSGPGSFTGVRIGVSTVKGFASALGKPCAAVDALETLAKGAGCTEALVCPVRDARAGQVYAAAFQNGDRILPDQVAMLQDFLTEAEKLSDRLLFVGDGAPVFEKAIRERLNERAVFASPAKHSVSPAEAGLIALAHPERQVSAEELLPLYLRAPQAERERMRREQAHG